MRRMIPFTGSFIARAEGGGVQDEGRLINHRPDEVNNPRLSRDPMVKGDRKRKKGWSYHVVTHDWPVGVGTVSESLPREARYNALNSFDSAYDRAMQDLAGTKSDDPALSSECVETES